MTDAVRGNPRNGTTFHRQRSADGQEIFDTLRRFVGTMGQQAVVAHSNAEAQGNPVKRKRGEESRPTEEEKGRDCLHMKDGERGHCCPIDSVSVRERKNDSVHEIFPWVDRWRSAAQPATSR